MTATMRVEVLLFAGLREAAGRRAVELELEPPATARDAWRAATLAHPRLAGGEQALRVAVNERYTTWEHALQDGDVVAFIPPVAGGAGDGDGGAGASARISVRITRDPLDARALEEIVRTDADGAVCTFTGAVRDHSEGRAVTSLEYEAYEGMAEREIRGIAEQALTSFAVTAVAAWHRLGPLAIGEASVVVSVSAHHRGAAFDACRWIMDTLKAEAPIWKRELGEGGAVWVDETARSH